MTTTELALKEVEGALHAHALLGDNPKAGYYKFARLIHPDVVPASLKVRAQKAFAKLTQFYSGSIGKTVPPVEKVIGSWIVGEPFAHGDLCDLYRARSVKDETKTALFKLARSPRDADLLEQEYVSLGILHQENKIEPKSAFQNYLPQVLDRAEASSRRANLISAAPESHSLADLMGLYPKGFDFRHSVWMLNRALSVLGFAHLRGIVHGAVTPEHLLYGPKSHSLTLVDWCYSVSAESKKHIPAIMSNWKGLYPPEVPRKHPAHPATDIYMLFASMLATHTKPPKRFAGVFDWAMASSPRSRPQSAWELQDRFLAVAKEEYGEPRYLALEIPIT